MSLIGRIPGPQHPVTPLQFESPAVTADTSLASSPIVDSMTRTSAAPQSEGLGISSPAKAASAPVASPWPALARANLLMTVGVVPGPVGASLDTQARAGLLDVLTRLDAKGVHMFKAGEQKDAPPVLLTPGETLARIEGQPAIFEHPLYAGGGHQKPWPLRNLVDVEVLDSLHLGDALVTGADPALVDALRSLEQAGYTAWQDKQPVDLLSAFHQASGAKTPTVRLRPPGSTDTDYPANSQGIYALDFFHGSGREDNLKDVDLGRSLKEFEKRGYVFRQGRERRPFALEDVHQTLQSSNDYACIGMTRADGPFVNLLLSLIRDPDAADRYVDEAEALMKVLSALPEIESHPAESMVYGLMKDTPSLSPQERTLLATRLQPLMAALEKAPQVPEPSEKSEKSERRDPLAEALADLEKAKALLGPGQDLEPVLQDYCRLLQSVPREQALEHLTYAHDTLRRQSFDKGEHEQLAGAWWHLLDQVKTPEVARTALGLLQIAVGGESFDDRLRLLDEIAARESDATLGRTATDYEAVLGSRLVGETLVDAGTRFVTVLGALAVGRQQERASEVFGFIQKGTARQAFGARDADEATRAFLEKFVLVRDVDLAMESLRHADPSASSGQIAQGEGEVDIGGVRIPVRK